ncbi:ExbD/TolR family protein [Crateriforma conspicua]|uniref:Biopolymer transport protein ExbD/TolR n=1 Tax=Crateriforma conspicua TaxID=2527996 RepID=A0A5C5Y8K7_9PLAN|nr:biopolymer transporter ExbD [Crateriforma conspicua]QDV62161.1 Biopolymer transport protein ExbD/TolR [Crateriforma conspicua]TWT71670.1 Biopolymer transport protein ExbD/TolR [Crateriforma conspicua]
MKVPAASEATSLEVKMTPMIDVVFLLLVFFVWTSSFEKPEFDLPSSIVQPPQGTSEVETADQPAESFDEIVVRLIESAGTMQIRMNGQAIDTADQLRQRLSEILALDVEPSVVIDPDGNITMDDAVHIYDVARSAGAARVLFATDDTPDAAVSPQVAP